MRDSSLNNLLFYMGKFRVLISSLYDAHILNMANLNQSIYIAFTASSLMELPGSLVY